MSNGVQSPCLVEFIPAGGSALTLLQVGDWMVDHPQFAAAQDLFEMDGIRQRNGYFNPIGNVLVTITISIDQDRNDFADAWLEADWLGTVPLLNVNGALRITSLHRVWTYPTAVIASIAPNMPGEWGPELARVFTIQACLPTAEAASGGTFIRPSGGGFIRPGGGTFNRP